MKAMPPSITPTVCSLCSRLSLKASSMPAGSRVPASSTASQPSNSGLVGLAAQRVLVQQGHEAGIVHRRIVQLEFQAGREQCRQVGQWQAGLHLLVQPCQPAHSGARPSAA